MNAKTGYVVVDVWRAKPGKLDEVERVLADSGQRFRRIDGINSVDYTRLEGTDDTFLIVFRYKDKDAREQFAESEVLKSTMAHLRQLWDLESPIYKGLDTGY